MEQRRWVIALRRMGAFLLMMLTACTSTVRVVPSPSSPGGTSETRTHDVVFLEPHVGASQPVPVEMRAFQQALRRLARGQRWEGPPRDAAQALMQREMEREGEWFAEVIRGRVTLVPLEEGGALESVEEVELKRHYASWCEARGGGDCLGLFSDGPHLRTDDRRTLALALAFGSVLEESREALMREVLDPRQVVAAFVWTAGLYLSLWLVPEPITKALAATLSIILVGWLGVDTFWGLVEGWAKLAQQAHEARTFDELRAAGAQYAKVLGTHAARALVMAVASLTGRTLGEIGARVQSLPGFQMAMEGGSTQGLSLPVALESVESVGLSLEGTLAVVMVSQNNLVVSMASMSSGARVTTVIRHRGGNQQVVLSNGQRWHLPRGKSPKDIPMDDPLGDELQAAANRVAKEWGPDKLTPAEEEVIKDALKQGQPFQAARCEGQARGRWVERQMRVLFGHLKWNAHGVDVTNPSGQDYHYELLAGTADNFGRHGRRMSDTFFRMISF